MAKSVDQHLLYVFCQYFFWPTIVKLFQFLRKLETTCLTNITEIPSYIRRKKLLLSFVEHKKSIAWHRKIRSAWRLCCGLCPTSWPPLSVTWVFLLSRSIAQPNRRMFASVPHRSELFYSFYSLRLHRQMIREAKRGSEAKSYDKKHIIRKIDGKKLQ